MTLLEVTRAGLSANRPQKREQGIARSKCVARDLRVPANRLSGKYRSTQVS